MANEYAVNKNDLTSVANAIRTKGGTSAKLTFPSGFVSTIQGIKTGTELNFSVVGGTSKPGSPKENTIWVNTGTAITGWVINTEKPASPVNGMVWLMNAPASYVAFNALKVNAIQVYPVSAKQYVSGAWKEVSATIYQDGSWKNMSEYLYVRGNQCTSITGGWVQSYQNGLSQGAMEFREDCMYVPYTNTSVCDLVTVKPINLNGVKQLRLKLEDLTTTNLATSFVVLFIATANNPPANSIAARINTKTNEAVLSVANYNGSYYVSVSGGQQVSYKITEVLMER